MLPRVRPFILVSVAALVSAFSAAAEIIPIPPPSGDYEQPARDGTNRFPPVTLSGLSVPGAVAPRPAARSLEMIAPAGGTSSPGVHNSIHTQKKVLALTFDDGPHGQLTPRLLDILKEEKVKATFFVLGTCVQDHPDVAKRIVLEGHEIANHSWDHPRLPGVSAKRLDQEIDSTTALIQKTTGQRVTLLRPTYGALDERVKKEVLGRGLQIILWSVDPRDWKRPGSAVVTRRLVEGAHPGAILLVHDIHPGTIDAIPGTISQLKAMGYKFVTVSELLAMDEPRPPAEPELPPAASGERTRN